jgi:hypothetical protein
MFFIFPAQVRHSATGDATLIVGIIAITALGSARPL